MLDKKDKIIYDNLIQNCRIPLSKLAKLTRLSHPAVLHRIKNLENKDYISSYDIFPNLTKFPNLNAYFYLIESENNLFEEFKKIPNLISYGEMISKENILFLTLESENNEILKILEKNNIKFRRFQTRNIRKTNYSIYGETKLEKEKKISNLNKLNDIDLKLIEHLSFGRGRDSLLKVSQDLNLTYDIVSYNFKKLEKAGMFLLKIAQPSKKLFNLQLDYVIINTKDLDFEKIYDKLKLLDKIPHLVQFDENTYFTIILSTSFENYKDTLKQIYSKLGNNLINLEILTGKDWKMSNRFLLSKIYGNLKQKSL